MHWWSGAGSRSVCSSLFCLVCISLVEGSSACGECLWSYWYEEGGETEEMVRSAPTQTHSWGRHESNMSPWLALVSSNLYFLNHVVRPVSMYRTQNPRPGRNHWSHLLWILGIPGRWSSSFCSQWRCQRLLSLRSICCWKGFLLNDLSPLFSPTNTFIMQLAFFNISVLCHHGRT